MAEWFRRPRQAQLAHLDRERTRANTQHDSKKLPHVFVPFGFVGAVETYE